MSTVTERAGPPQVMLPRLEERLALVELALMNLMDAVILDAKRRAVRYGLPADCWPTILPPAVLRRLVESREVVLGKGAIQE